MEDGTVLVGPAILLAGREAVNYVGINVAALQLQAQEQSTVSEVAIDQRSNLGKGASLPTKVSVVFF